MKHLWMAYKQRLGYQLGLAFVCKPQRREKQTQNNTALFFSHLQRSSKMRNPGQTQDLRMLGLTSLMVDEALSDAGKT